MLCLITRLQAPTCNKLPCSHKLILAYIPITSWVHVTDQVSTALEEDAHFFALADEKWCLAVYQPLRWGFAGTSKIAEDFIEALGLVPGAELMTCAARNKDRLPQAQEFAKKHGEY